MWKLKKILIFSICIIAILYRSASLTAYAEATHTHTDHCKIASYHKHIGNPDKDGKILYDTYTLSVEYWLYDADLDSNKPQEEHLTYFCADCPNCGKIYAYGGKSLYDYKYPTIKHLCPRSGHTSGRVGCYEYGSHKQVITLGVEYWLYDSDLDSNKPQEEHNTYFCADCPNCGKIYAFGGKSLHDYKPTVQHACPYLTKTDWHLVCGKDETTPEGITYRCVDVDVRTSFVSSDGLKEYSSFTNTEVGYKNETFTPSNAYESYTGYHFGSSGIYTVTDIDVRNFTPVVRVANKYTVNVYLSTDYNSISKVDFPNTKTPKGWSWSTDHFTRSFDYDGTSMDYSPADLFSVPGYSIDTVNYYSDKACTTVKCQKGDKNLTSTDGEVINLYVKCMNNTYTANIYPNKPSNASSNVVHPSSASNWAWSTDHWTRKFTYDSTTIGLNPDSFYSLTGWTIGSSYYLNTSGTGTSYSSNSKNLTTSNNGTVNLYVKWSPNTYTVTFKQNKPSSMSSTITGRADNSTVTVKYDHTDNNSVTTCSATGWIFQGWYDSASGGTKVYDASGNAVASNGYWSASKTWVKTSSVTLYAQWTPIEYNIIYDKNKPTKASHDVTGTTASSHHFYDTAKTLTPNGYSLVGWRFNGWNTKADGKGTSYSNSASVKNLTTINGGTVTLYAQWIQNTYTVNIYQNKPSNASHNINRVTTSLSGYTWNTDHWSKTFTYDDTKIGYSPSQIFSLKGWTIDGNNYYSANNGTGTTYNKDSSNLTATHGGTVNLYVKWTANKYNLYYDKGLTTDTSTTTITDATRNANIQKSGTDRPYTTATYDNDLTIAKIGGLVGRKYELNFNSNKPSSISKQKQNNSANPTSVAKITGNLPSKGQWQISGQDSDVTANLTPAVGSKLTKPNYKDANNTSLVATALWNNKVLNNFSSPTLEGWKFVGWYDNQSGANSTPVSNTTDMVKTVNTTTNVSPNSNVTDTHNVTAFTVQPKTTEFNQTLYARWQRTITLTFNMNGGQYQGDEANVILTGVYYNNADGYNFSLTSTPTAAKTPEYEKQINQIDAYGTYDNNGENKKYTKYDVTTGITYRFIGWSTNKNATEPETKFIVFSSSKVQTLRLYDNTTLYAVWEPVLITSLEVNRTLGDLTFNDGTKLVNRSTPRRATDDVQTLGIIIKPGEQGSYTINSYGRTDRKAGVEFDPKIEDIYRNKGLWTDNLNPNTGTGEEYFESSGLTRIFNPATSHIMRKFYIPQYLGTPQSYASSIGVTVYGLEVAIWQDSYYYKYIAGENGVEAVLYPVYIYIVTDKSSTTPTDPTDPTPPSSEEPVISVLDELRTKLKIRLH